MTNVCNMEGMKGEKIKRPRPWPCLNQMSDDRNGENRTEALTVTSVKCSSDLCTIKDGGNTTDDKLSNSSNVDISQSMNYRIPKLSRNHHDLLSEVKLSSYEFQHEILPKITQHLYHNSSERLTIKKCCLVNNSELATKFAEKKNALKNEGYTDKELSELFGFLSVFGVKKNELVSEVIKHGLKVGNKESSLIGHPQLGIHLSRYVDVIPKVTTESSAGYGQIIIFKFLKGRVKTVPINMTGNHSDPTPNYDCHVNKPVTIETKQVTDQQLLDQNQIYLYEYNEEGKIVEYPSQILPYAVLDVIYKPTHSSKTLNSPQIKKLNPRDVISRSPLIGAHKLNSPLEEYIVWNGKLSLKGSYVCNVTMISSAGYVKPVRLGSNINICNRSEIKRAEEKYFDKLNQLNKCQETFWRRRYINVTELKPKPGSTDHFQKITRYLSEKICLAIVKPDSNTVLFLMPACSLTARLGLSSTENEKYDRLYCLFLSKQSTYLNSPEYTYCMFKTTGKVPGVESFLPQQIFTEQTMDNCNQNLSKMYPSGIRTPVKNNLGPLNSRSPNENSTFTSPQHFHSNNIYNQSYSSPILLGKSPPQKISPINRIRISPYSKSPMSSPSLRSKFFDDFTQPIGNVNKLTWEKVRHTFDCQYSLELYERRKICRVESDNMTTRVNPYKDEVNNPESHDICNQKTAPNPTMLCKTKLTFDERKPDSPNIAHIPNSGNPCSYENLSPDIASAKLNFPQIYSGLDSSEDNSSTDYESIGTDLDSPHWNNPLSGIATVNDMKDFLNETVNRDEKRCLSDVKSEAVSLILNINTQSETCPETPSPDAFKKHAVSHLTSLNTVGSTTSIDSVKNVGDKHSEVAEDKKQTKEKATANQLDKCISHDVADFKKQFKAKEDIAKVSSEDACLFEIANIISQRCSQGDSLDEDEDKSVFGSLKSNSRNSADSTYIGDAASTKPTPLKSSTIKLTSAKTSSLQPVESASEANSDEKVQLKEPLIDSAYQTSASMERSIKSGQISKSSVPCNNDSIKESTKDAEVRLCLADIQNQIVESSFHERVKITHKMPIQSMQPPSVTDENVACSMSVLDTSNKNHDDNPSSKCDSDTSTVDNQKTSKSILKVGRNVSQPDPDIQKTDLRVLPNPSKDYAKPLRISIPEDDNFINTLLPDKFIPNYSSDEELPKFDTPSNKGEIQLTSNDLHPSKNSEYVLDILDSTSTGFLDEDLNPPSDSVSSFTQDEDLTADRESKLDYCATKTSDEQKSHAIMKIMCMTKNQRISPVPVLPVPKETESSTTAEDSKPNNTKVDSHDYSALPMMTLPNPYVSLNQINITQDEKIVELRLSSSQILLNKEMKDDNITQTKPLQSTESDVDNAESSALSDFPNFLDNSDYQVVDEVYSSDETDVNDPNRTVLAEICEETVKKTDVPLSVLEQTKISSDKNIYSIMNKSLEETKNDAQLSQPIVNLTRCDSPNSPFNIQKLFPSKFIDIKPFNELFSESIRKIKMAKSSNRLKLSKKFDQDDQKFLTRLETIHGEDSESSDSSDFSHKSGSTHSKSSHRSKHDTTSTHSDIYKHDRTSTHSDIYKHDRKISKDTKHKKHKHSSEKSSAVHSEQSSVDNHHHHKKTKKHSKTKSETVLEKTSKETKHKKSRSSALKTLESVDEGVKSKRDSHSRSRSDDVTGRSVTRQSKHSKKQSKSERNVQLVISPSKSPHALSVKDQETIDQVKGPALLTNFLIPKKKDSKSNKDKSMLNISETSVKKASSESLKREKGKQLKSEITKTKLFTSALKQAGVELKTPTPKKDKLKKMPNVESVKDIGQRVEQNLAEQLKGSNSIVEKFLLISATDFPDARNNKDGKATEFAGKSGPAKDERKHRQFHPYTAPPVASKKKQWASFDLPVSNLKALMRDLTTYSYLACNQTKGHGRVERDRYNSWSRHERRFSNYVFHRSEVPADDEEVECDFDADDFVDYEERKRQAELVDQPLDEEDKLLHQRDDIMFEEELRLYAGNDEDGDANILTKTSPTNSIESLPNLAGSMIGTVESKDHQVDVDFDDQNEELVCQNASDIGAAIDDGMPEVVVNSSTSDEGVIDIGSQKESDNNSNVQCRKQNVPFNLSAEKQNMSLGHKMTLEHSELFPNDLKTLEEHVEYGNKSPKVLQNTETSCMGNEVAGSVPKKPNMVQCKTGASILKSKPGSLVTPKKKYNSIIFNIKKKYSPEAEKAKKISVHIGHGVEAIPHTQSEIPPEPSSGANSNLIEVPLCSGVSLPPVSIGDKSEIYDVNKMTSNNCHESSNFSLDQSFPKSATFLKVDQMLLSKVSKTIFQSYSSPDENVKEQAASEDLRENTASPVHIESTALVTETEPVMNSKTTAQDVKDSIDELTHKPISENKKAPDLSIRTEVIDDLESMRNLLNCDLKPVHPKGYPRDFHVQTITYDSGIRPTPVPFHKKFEEVDKIIPKPVFSAISHDIVIKPISNNLKKTSPQFQSSLLSPAINSELLCFSKNSNFKFGSTDTNPVCDNSGQVNFQKDGNISSDSSTPVKDEILLSQLEFGTPLKDEVSRFAETTHPNKAQFQIPCSSADIPKSDLKGTRGVDSGNMESGASIEKSSNDVHKVMINMWKKITSKPDPRKVSPRKYQPSLQSNVNSSEETDSEGKQFKPKLQDPRKASPRKIQAPIPDCGGKLSQLKVDTDVPIKIKPKFSPIIFDKSTYTDTVDHSSDSRNTVQKPASTKKTKPGIGKKIRHISGIHPKCKDYWQYTVESITFVNLHIKHIANPELKDFAVEFRPYFEDPRIEMTKGNIARNICPNTGLVVKPKSSLQKKFPNSKQLTRTVSEDPLKASTSRKAGQKNEAIKQQRSKSLEIKSENLEKKNSSENFDRLNSQIVSCVNEDNSQENSKSKCKKSLLYIDKSKTLISCGTKRKAESSDDQTAKSSRQEFTSNDNGNSLRDELLEYALDSKNIPPSKSERNILPVFDLAGQHVEPTCTDPFYLTSSSNLSEIMQVDKSKNVEEAVGLSSKHDGDPNIMKNFDDKVFNIPSEICPVVKKVKAPFLPTFEPKLLVSNITNNDTKSATNKQTLDGTCDDNTTEAPIPDINITHPFTTNLDDSPSGTVDSPKNTTNIVKLNSASENSGSAAGQKHSISKQELHKPPSSVTKNAQIDTSSLSLKKLIDSKKESDLLKQLAQDVVMEKGAEVRKSSANKQDSELQMLIGYDSAELSSIISSDSQKNTNDSYEISHNLYSQTIERSCSSPEEGEVISSDESKKRKERKRHIIDGWEDKELSLVDSVAEIRNQKERLTKRKRDIDRESPSEEWRIIEDIIKAKKSKMTERMDGVLNKCSKSDIQKSNSLEEEVCGTQLSESQSDREQICNEKDPFSEPDVSKNLPITDTCNSYKDNNMATHQRSYQGNPSKEATDNCEDQVVGLISLPNEPSNFYNSSMELESSCHSDLIYHSTDSRILSSRNDMSEFQSFERNYLVPEVRMKKELPSLFSQTRGDDHFENQFEMHPEAVDQLGVLSPGRFACPIQHRISPPSDITLSGHEIPPQLGLQHPIVNLQPQIETPNALNVDNDTFIRHEAPMFNNYNFNFGPVYHHNYLLQQVNPVFKQQMYQQHNPVPVPHRNIYINPSMMVPNGPLHQNLVMMSHGLRPTNVVTRPSLTSTPNSSRSVSPTSPELFKYSHRLVSDRDPMLSDSVHQTGPDYPSRPSKPDRPQVEDFVGQDLNMMSQNQPVYLKDLMLSKNLSDAAAVLKKREEDPLISEKKKSKISVSPLNSETLFLKESMKSKLCQATKQTHTKFSDVVNDASTSANYGEARKMTPVKSTTQENFRPIYPKSFASVNCVVMLEDNFLLHRSLEVLEALFLQLSHSVQGWKVFIHAGVISILEKRSKHGIIDAVTVEAMQLLTLVEKYKLRGLIVLVNTCRCSPSQSLLEEKTVCLKQIQSVLYPQSNHTVLITDFVNNMQQMNNGLIISSLDPFYKRFCSR